MLITHVDLDGCGSAVIWRAATGHPYRLVDNGEVDAAVQAELDHLLEHDAEGTRLVVADHSVREPSIPLIETYLAAGGRFTMLDHHKSALPLAVHEWARVDLEHSGAWLLWDHLGRPPALADFAFLVEDHDLWRHTDDRSARLAALLGLLGAERFIERFAADPTVGFREGELLLLEVEDARRTDYIARRLEKVTLVETGGHRWAIAYAESYLSDLAQAMSDRFGVDATAVVNANSDKVTVSLRSRVLDVSVIAQARGGGGHAAAAAFSARTAGLDGGRHQLHQAIVQALGA